MTAELSVMNKRGVALAADSAVSSDNKIYNSSNKLFSLSEEHSVGIMIYNVDSLNDVPWETIIKCYRDEIGDSPKSTLSDYYVDLIKFIENIKENNLFDQEQIDNSIRTASFITYSKILDSIDDELEEKLRSSNTKFTETFYTKYFQDYIKNYYSKLNSLPYSLKFNIASFNSLTNQYKNMLNDLIDYIFEQINLSKLDRNRLVKIGVFSLIKDIFVNFTGVVIAGFGKNEVYPSIYSLKIENLLSYKIRNVDKQTLKFQFDSDKCHTIDNFKGRSFIAPFGQDDMSRLFLDGIDSKLSQYSKIELDDLHFNLKKRIKNKLSSVGTNRLITDIDTMIDECYNNYSEKLENYQNIVYQSPVKASISILPMNELSIMAETLVNLTSFKRQMSHNQQETVGGPTDVAIITKGDGFRWIKRKTL